MRQSLANDLAGEFGTSKRVAACIAQLAFAQVAREITDAHFKSRRFAVGASAFYRDPVMGHLSQLDGGEIRSDVRCQVGAGIARLVEKLLLDGCERDRAAGPFNLAQHGVSIAVDIGTVKADVG